MLSVSFGVLRDVWSRSDGFDCRPKAIKNFISYSVISRRIEGGILDTCRRYGIAVTA